MWAIKDNLRFCKFTKFTSETLFDVQMYMNLNTFSFHFSYRLLRPPGASRKTRVGRSLYRAPQPCRGQTVTGLCYQAFPTAPVGEKKSTRIIINRKTQLQDKPYYVSHEKHEGIFGWNAEVFPINGDLMSKQNVFKNRKIKLACYIWWNKTLNVLVEVF